MTAERNFMVGNTKSDLVETFHRTSTAILHPAEWHLQLPNAHDLPKNLAGISLVSA
jgi:hypothetical protein